MFRQINIVVILFISSVINAKAQINIADSLKKELASTDNDSLKIILFCQISDVYANFQPDTALFFAQQGLTIAQESESQKGESRCLTRMGNIYKTIGNFPKALEIHLSALKLSESIDDQTGIGASYNNMAEVYKEQGDYQNALNYYTKTGIIFNKIISKIEKDKDPNNIEDNERKIKINRKFLGIINMNIGDTYERMGMLDSALLFQKKAYMSASSIGDNDNIGATLCNLGAIYSRIGNSNEALKNFKQSIPYLEMIEDKQFLSITYNGMSELFQKYFQPDSALFYAHKSLTAAKEGNFQKEIFNAALLLSGIFEKRQRPDSAFFYQKLATAVKDSMFNQEKVRKVEDIKFSEQIRQQELALAREKAAKERRDSLQYFAISIFIITLFIVLILMRRKKTKTKLIEYFGVIGLLLLFEFIALFIHPYIGNWTHHTPIYMLIILVGIAAILTPAHHIMTHWVKHKLALKHEENHPKESPVVIENTSGIAKATPALNEKKDLQSDEVTPLAKDKTESKEEKNKEK